MRYYPVNLNISNRNCIVVGGGGVGTRKVISLLECGAHVTVVSPETSAHLAKLAASKTIIWRQRSYQASDLDGMFLVIGATDDEELNHRIYKDAEQSNILCNIADRPKSCNFILPAVVRQGDLILTISTSGQSPAFAKQLRREFQKTIGPEYAALLMLMGAIRKQLLSQEHAPEAHKPLFEKLLQGGLLEMVRHHQIDEIDELLLDVLGEGYKYKDLLNVEN